MGQPTGDVARLRDRRGAVELDDGVGRQRRQVVVEGGDAFPAGVRGGAGCGVLDRDRRLQHVPAGRTEPQGARGQEGGLGDRLRPPARAVLVVEQHERTGGVDASVATGVVREEQRLEAESIRLVGHELGDHRGQADRLSAQRAPQVRAIQAMGSRGTPSRGQRSTAATNASCTASSARSQSPTARISAATARPKCSRNRPSTEPPADASLRTRRPRRRPLVARRPRSR
jgi:hypothetical protein